jgi:AraC-like DNA-binding protein
MPRLSGTTLDLARNNPPFSLQSFLYTFRSEMQPQFNKYFAISLREKEWGLYVTGVGHAEISPGSDYPPPVHPAAYTFRWERGRVLDEFVALYITKGGGIFSSNETADIRIRSGDVLMISPGQWHRYRPDPATGWEEFWVTFDGPVADTWRSEGFFAHTKTVIATNMQLEVEENFERLIHLAKRQPYAPYLMAGLCHGIVGAALSISNSKTMDEGDRRLLAAAEYLRNHATTVDLAWLARQHGMSPSTFRRRFHDHFDCSPVAYLAMQRIAAAKRYLAETDLPLKRIAQQLGYSTEFYFMRVFKQHTGFTPTEWRCQPSGTPGSEHC